jgi:hypothetical protein
MALDLFAEVETLLSLAHERLSPVELDQVGVAVRRWVEEGLSPAQSAPKLVAWDKDRIADRLIGYLQTTSDVSPDRVDELLALINERLPNY